MRQTGEKMSEEFVVSYWIDNDEWNRAAAARQDPDAEPIFDYFYGPVQIRVNGCHILDEHGYHMSVADLACGMAAILRSEIAIVGDQEIATFNQSDDSLEIKFSRQGERIDVSSNRPATRSENTNVSAFLRGSREFIQRFALEASKHVPAVLEWRDLVILREYAGKR